jgi:transcriptional regulator with XRE-family HTH domain
MAEQATETIGSRAKTVREELELNQQAIADRMGVSLRAWQKMERDEGTPSGETLLNFQKLGINPGWVLTGLGPRKLLTWASGDTEAEIFMRIADMVQDVHSGLGIELPNRGLASATRAIFDRLIKQIDPQAGPSEFEALMTIEGAKLKRQLLDAISNPGTGKRSVS